VINWRLSNKKIVIKVNNEEEKENKFFSRFDHHKKILGGFYGYKRTGISGSSGYV
jgi:hypothetical protein